MLVLIFINLHYLENTYKYSDLITAKMFYDDDNYRYYCVFVLTIPLMPRFDPEGENNGLCNRNSVSWEVAIIIIQSFHELANSLRYQYPDLAIITICTILLYPLRMLSYPTSRSA